MVEACLPPPRPAYEDWTDQDWFYLHNDSPPPPHIKSAADRELRGYLVEKGLSHLLPGAPTRTPRFEQLVLIPL